MTRIRLKSGSPEFYDPEDAIPQSQTCYMPGCDEHGEFRAPKNRELTEYYNFCQDHVREYNKAWNFFSGMSDSEVQAEMMKSAYGDRPTWKYGEKSKASEEKIREKIWDTYEGSDFAKAAEERKKEEQRRRYQFDTHRHTPEYEAMIVMELSPPVTYKEIRTQYKNLAKIHHPDLNKGCPESVERLKQINMAYTILKLAYENFDKLDQEN